MSPYMCSMLLSSEVFSLVAAMLYITCVLMVFYTLESAYRISYFLCAALMMLAVPASFSSWIHSGVQPTERASSPPAEDKKNQ